MQTVFPSTCSVHNVQLGWKHGCLLCASIRYLQSDTGSILDLKWHFLPIQCDLSGVERSWGERKRHTDEWTHERINSRHFLNVFWSRGLLQREISWQMHLFLLLTLINVCYLITDKWTETHQCLLHNPRWTSWSETWQSELKRNKNNSDQRRRQWI